MKAYLFKETDMNTIDNCPIPDPCETQEFKVVASASYPKSELSWEVDLPLAEFTIYRNSTYLLISLLVSAISVIFTRMARDGDQGRATASFNHIRRAMEDVIDDD
jgi:hypothetical protein